MTISNDFTIRPPTPDDLDATVALINACSRADTFAPLPGAVQVGVDVFTLSSLRRTWTAGGFNLATDAWLIVSPDRQVIAYGEFYDAQPPESYEVSGWVHPDYRGRGLGSHLLRTVEGRAQQAMLKAPPDVRISLSQGTYAANTGARALLEQMGYQNVRRWQRMSIEMDAPPPAPRLPDGITIRTFDRGREDRVVHQAYEEAMADEWGHPPLTFDEWLHYKIDTEDNFDPTLWFLATDGPEIAGLAICRWERPGEPDEGHVRDLGVRPAWRRRGIALALLQSVFVEFYRRGKRKVGLGVDATSLTGADRLYAKVGMRVVLESLVYEKELRPGKSET